MSQSYASFTVTVILSTASGLIRSVTDVDDWGVALHDMAADVGFEAETFDKVDRAEDGEFSVYTVTGYAVPEVTDEVFAKVKAADDNVVALVGYFRAVTTDDKTVRLLDASLETAQKAGMTVHYSGIEDNGIFAIDLETGAKVDFHGFSSHPAFTVTLADGFETDIEYDVSQMPVFENEAALYRQIANDPIGMCRAVVEIAEDRKIAA